MTEPNFVNRTIFTGDNLAVLRGMNSGSVDLVYLDPPFNSKKAWNAPIGSKAAGAAFKDTWTLSDVDVQTHERLRKDNPGLHDVILAARAAGGTSTMSYLLMMSERLLELRRVLKPEGSLYLHCDPTESHSLKLMLDVIFGRDAFRSEIVWKRSHSSGSTRSLGNVVDNIFHYGTPGGTYHRVVVPLSDAELDAKFGMTEPDTGRRFTTSQVMVNDATLGKGQFYEYKGIYPPKGWFVSKKQLRAWDDEGRIHWSKNGMPRRKYYADEYEGKPVNNLWADINIAGPKERTGYPTQKPVALLKRIIKASSNEGDVVLDPFAGCATAAVAAEDLGRQWVGIDLSDKAAELVKYRLEEHLGLFYDINHHIADREHPRFEAPIERTDLGRLPKPSTHKKALYGEQEGRCAACGEHFTIDLFDVDHIIPKAKGGTDHRSNLQLLDVGCHRRKGTGSMSKLMVKLLQSRGIETEGREGRL